MLKADVGVYVPYTEGDHQSICHAGTSAIGYQKLCVKFQLSQAAHQTLCRFHALLSFPSSGVH